MLYLGAIAAATPVLYFLPSFYSINGLALMTLGLAIANGIMTRKGVRQ